MIPRYGLKYRQKELSKICEYAPRGDSLAFVGIAGTGKSNITSFLCQDPYEYKPQYLHNNLTTTHFVLIDATTWKGTAESLLQLMFDALSEIQDELPQEVERPNITPLAPIGERTKRRLNDLVNWFCSELGHRLMFILDDFDALLKAGPLATLEELSRLRNANKGSISYLMFTKALPHVLGISHDLENKSKFYDLFKGNIFSLGLYSDEDSRQMLLYLNEVAGTPLNRGDLLTIQHYGGGHARLIKLLFDCWRQEPPPAEQALGYFSTHSDILKECERIMNGLHPDERSVIIRAAKNSLNDDDYMFIDYLMTRGLLIRTVPLMWFSPVMAEYLRTLV